MLIAYIQFHLINNPGFADRLSAIMVAGSAKAIKAQRDA